MQDCDLEYHYLGVLFIIWVIPVHNLSIVRSVMRLASTKLVIITVFNHRRGEIVRKVFRLSSIQVVPIPFNT